MVKLEEHKLSTQNKLIEIPPAPQQVYLPLLQHIGKSCQPLVKIGDQVYKGEKIAAVEAHVYAPIHASVSGKVTAIQDWPHPVLGKCKTIVIENDGQDTITDQGRPSQEVIDNLTAEQIRGIVFQAGIVGMGGASFPTHIKLTPPKSVDTLIINGAECEPYLTADYRLMVEKTEQILRGVLLVARCLGVDNIYIAIEDNKPLAIKRFAEEQAFFSRDGKSAYTIKVLKSAYPQGGEKQLIKNILAREVPSGKLPFEIGVVVQNVATCLAVYEAVYLNKVLYERVVTITGDCLGDCKNVLVRIGTPIKQLIDFCGPLREEPRRLIIGGPMMGIAQHTDTVPVIKSTTGVLVFHQLPIGMEQEESCIRCGECIRDCPAYLMPTLLNLAARAQKWSECKEYGALDCIECGVCSYVCPSRIQLVQSIKRAKLELIR